MSRRKNQKKRAVPPDALYNSCLVNMLIRRVMRDGKKSLAAGIVYDALKTVGERTGEDPIETFEKAMKNLTPLVEVKARRVGGATYQVPMEVRPKRRQSLAIKWIVRAARARSEYRMSERLANELLDAAQNQGAAFKKKEETHKMAEANRAFAHFRW
jgi:small subunit ribosomal protein S7